MTRAAANVPAAVPLQAGCSGEAVHARVATGVWRNAPVCCCMWSYRRAKSTATSTCSQDLHARKANIANDSADCNTHTLCRVKSHVPCTRSEIHRKHSDTGQETDCVLHTKDGSCRSPLISCSNTSHSRLCYMVLRAKRCAKAPFAL